MPENVPPITTVDPPPSQNYTQIHQPKQREQQPPSPQPQYTATLINGGTANAYQPNVDPQSNPFMNGSDAKDG